MTITTYRITATMERDGQLLACTQPEVLGDDYGREYATEADAQKRADELHEETQTGDYDLDPSTRYHVESVEHTIEVIEVDEEWAGEDDDGEPLYDDLDAYVSVDVRIDGEHVPVGVGVGIPERQQGSARASGAMDTYGVTAWWVDSSDHQSVPPLLRDAVFAALTAAAPKLWRQAVDARGVA